MSEIDYDAYQDSEKGLSIIFIIGIFAVNAALLFKIYKKNSRFIYNAKHLTLISLAIGDIFLALFSLVVRARQAFESVSSLDLGCSTLVSARFYTFLITFVYGVGLIMLAVEVAVRERAPTSPSNQGGNLVKAVIFSAVPWFLGLVIILPLTMAGTDWDSPYCGNPDMTYSRVRAWYWVSACLPAAAAFFTCILIMCIKPSRQPTQTMALASAITPNTPSPSYPDSNTAPPPPYPDNNNVNDSSKASQQPPATIIPGYNQYQYPQQTPGYQYQYPQQTPGYQYPQQANNQYPQYAPNQHYYAQPYSHQPGAYGPAPVYIAQPPVTLTPSSTDLSKEKNILMWATCIYCFCVIPFSGFYVGYVYDTNRDYKWGGLAELVVSLTFDWLRIFRSFITPILWLGRSKVL